MLTVTLPTVLVGLVKTVTLDEAGVRVVTPLAEVAWAALPMLEREDWSAESCADMPVSEDWMLLRVDVMVARVFPIVANPFATEVERAEKSVVTILVRLVRPLPRDVKPVFSADWIAYSRLATESVPPKDPRLARVEVTVEVEIEVAVVYVVVVVVVNTMQTPVVG